MAPPDDGCSSKRRRAAPMSPDERREAIIRATIPLVQRHGFDVSTRQIADAAGIAEGTIFRVFDTKEALLHQAVQAALDPSDAERTLRDIDRTAPLEERVRIVAGLLQERMTTMIELVTAIGKINFPTHDSRERLEYYERITGLVTEIFEPDRHRLKVEPADAARMLQIIAFGGSHPRIAAGKVLTPDEICDLLLNGIRTH